MITNKQVDQIINEGRLYIPDEDLCPKPFKQVFKKFFPDTSPEWEELVSEWMDADWTEEQKKFLRDHGLDI